MTSHDHASKRPSPTPAAPRRIGWIVLSRGPASHRDLWPALLVALLGHFAVAQWAASTPSPEHAAHAEDEASDAIEIEFLEPPIDETPEPPPADPPADADAPDAALDTARDDAHRSPAEDDPSPTEGAELTAPREPAPSAPPPPAPTEPAPSAPPPAPAEPSATVLAVAAETAVPPGLAEAIPSDTRAPVVFDVTLRHTAVAATAVRGSPTTTRTSATGQTVSSGHRQGFTAGTPRSTTSRARGARLRREVPCRDWPSQALGTADRRKVVRLRVEIGVDGRVADPVVLDDPGLGFGAAAVACAKRQAFWPELDAQGHAAAVHRTIEVEFVR